jgi:hypothetical protein
VDAITEPIIESAIEGYAFISIEQYVLADIYTWFEAHSASSASSKR